MQTHALSDSAIKPLTPSKSSNQSRSFSGCQWPATFVPSFPAALNFSQNPRNLLHCRSETWKGWNWFLWKSLCRCYTASFRRGWWTRCQKNPEWEKKNHKLSLKSFKKKWLICFSCNKICTQCRVFELLDLCSAPPPHQRVKDYHGNGWGCL